ncbi:hypothetical protein D3C76_1547410 [compost metagenome]
MPPGRRPSWMRLMRASRCSGSTNCRVKLSTTTEAFSISMSQMSASTSSTGTSDLKPERWARARSIMGWERSTAVMLQPGCVTWRRMARVAAPREQPRS